MGTDNGDSTDEDGYKQSGRCLFGGKLLAIIASNGKTEDAVVTAESSEGLWEKLRIPVTITGPIPGTSCVQRIPETLCDRRIPVRKIEICAEGTRLLSAEHPECIFHWKQIPENAQGEPVKWQVTNDAGILSPFVETEVKGDRVRVTARGDGFFFLRALGGNSKDHPEIISQIEFSAKGIGNPPLNPYEFISAGLYDLHEGEIGTGNDKGIAFSREGESMVGFSRIDFCKAGSDTLTVPIFALNGDPYEIELLDGDPRNGGRLITVLHYEKPSIWNCYQEETWILPERLTGLHCLCFRMREKIHMKGFCFEKQSRAFAQIKAGEADLIYGDSYRREGSSVKGIGNNVTLVFQEMDFGSVKECRLMIRGSSELPMNTITIHIQNERGEEITEAVDYSGDCGNEQIFQVHVPGGVCTVTFVFLPGCSFDFEAFRFLM